MGGTLLGFAACLDSKPIVEYLLTNPYAASHGARLRTSSSAHHYASA